MAEQQSLDTAAAGEVEDGLVAFIALGWDGTAVGVIPNVTHKQHWDDHSGAEDTWKTAEQWCYLASRRYDSMMWLGHS